MTISRISRQAAEAASNPVWWRRLVPMPVSPVLAAAVPSILAALALAVTMAVRTGDVTPGPQVPARLDMQVEGQGVRLAWTDGHGRAYRVYKTTDPRLLGQGQGTVVHGNQWVDRAADSSPVVFYRVE